MAKQNRSITDKQVATFTKLVEQGMLQHLSNTGDWGTLEKIGEFMKDLVEDLPEKPYTSLGVAEHYYRLGMLEELVDSVAVYVSEERGELQIELLRKFVAKSSLAEDWIRDPEEQEYPLTKYSSHANRRYLEGILDMSHFSSPDEILKELASRIE